MNSSYADFKKGNTYTSPYGQGGRASTPTTTDRSKKTKTYTSPYGQGTPVSKPLKGTPAKPNLREPGMARNARSTAAGAKQGVRNATGWAGKRGIRSNIAGGTQKLREAGQFIMKNKVGTGLAAAGALGAGIGATALIRKMRSDKGKKRGQYSK